MHFPSGMVGISIVLFALMGTIGVGYLLNGHTTYEAVDTYDYVTDVTGLYEYTPVTAYAPYSPAQNNYQYSTTYANLGTYTSGITYTEAGAANLNPIITPESGSVTTNVTVPYADLDAYLVNSTLPTDMDYTWAQEINNGYTRQTMVQAAKLISVASLMESISGLTVLEIDTPNMAAEKSIAGVTQSFYVQPVGIAVAGYTGDVRPSTYSSFAVDNAGNAPLITTSLRNTLLYTTNSTLSFTGTDSKNYTTYPAGVVSDLTVYPNGIATYTYTYSGQSSTHSVSVSNLYIYVMGNTSALGLTGYTPGLTYTQTAYTDIDYLDPNYGVSTSASTVYWNNGNDLGSVQWLIKRPSGTTAQTFTAYHSDNTVASTFTVSYDTWWTLTYNGTNVNMGKAWDGILITAYYTGELQWSPVRLFINFTDYRLGNTNTIAASNVMNDPISYCTIEKDGTSFNFAVVGTSVASGSVPGAMYDASFTVSNYFPQYDDVRVSFDSAAYVGSTVRVGTWSMSVDSATFIGSFTGADGGQYRADLTKPWAIIWTSADNVAISFTPYNKMGTQTVTILSVDAAKVVNLDGQWVIDTDLYSISTHEEPVYNWNFGNWGLDKVPFIVCMMGLTALLAIGYRITGVTFGGLDMLILALANVVLWVIL